MSMKIEKMPENKKVPPGDIDLDGWELFRAAKENRVDITWALLARGDDLNAKDEDGRTPEEVALREYSVDVAKVLIIFKSNGWYLTRTDDQDYA